MACGVVQAAPWVRAKMEKEMEAGSWRGKAKEDPKGGARAAPNVLAQYREDTMRTTGELSAPLSKLSICAAWDHRQETPQRHRDAAATRDGKGQHSAWACCQCGNTRLLPPHRKSAVAACSAAAAAAGSASRSLTSSAVTLQTRNQRMMVRMERNPKKKGYMRLHTTLGDLNLELHCDIVPRTCENFMALAESGYYNDTVFHRSIRNFMIQVRHPLASVWPGFKPQT